LDQDGGASSGLLLIKNGQSGGGHRQRMQRRMMTGTMLASQDVDRVETKKTIEVSNDQQYAEYLKTVKALNQSKEFLAESNTQGTLEG
jgi:hypothetical protein